MTALEIYEAAFDSACKGDYSEDYASLLSYVIDYAEGAFGVDLWLDIARKIVEARQAYNEATWGAEGNGEYSNNYYLYIVRELEGIEV